MMEAGQFLERFRQLSREIQNGMQTAQKQLDGLKKLRDATEPAKQLGSTLAEVTEAWQDFSGWVLISTLEDLDEARANCAPGRVDLQSKIIRSKKRRALDAVRNGITVDLSDTPSTVIETYIPYFEQMLDLVFGNAVKYSPRGGTIEVTCERRKDRALITVRSVGPVVLKQEIPQLGERGFRAQHARNLPVTGQGFGLFNVRRIAELLGAEVAFSAEQKVLYESGGVAYANFGVNLSFPEMPPRGPTSD